LKLAIGLPLRDKEALEALLKQLSDPGSPNYRRYLTPEQFTARFAPTENDYQALIDFAKANGLTPTATHSNRVVLDVEGKVADIQKTFHTTLRTYRHPREARAFYAPEVEPSVDSSVPILQISGLDNYSLPHPNSTIKPSDSVGAIPLGGSGPNGTYWGYDFRTTYAPGTTLTGAGQSLGLLQFDGFYASDITNYVQQAGLPGVPPLTLVPVNGGVGTPGTNSSEVSLDLEMAISMAPGLSRIYVFEAPLGTSWVDLLNSMVAFTNIQQFSCSWSDQIPGRVDPTAEQIFQQMAAQGQSFFNATGDLDAFTQGIPFPSESPYITQVGGTTLTTTTNGAYLAEQVWNWGGGQGSSGGVSTHYPIPSYQQGVSMAANQGSTTMRNVPDVALTADNVYVVYGNGTNATVGGTSCAAPLWAGFMALVNQQASAVGLPPGGFLNPALYAIGQTSTVVSRFHDITTGNNTWAGSPNLFFAVPGYDLCTGWGTPNGAGLIDFLTRLDPWIISQPQSQSVNAGDSVTFDVTAGGQPPLNYQWSFNGQPISTATNESYSIARVQSIQAGTYSVVVSNSYGLAQSDSATLAINAGSGAFGIVGLPFLYQITATFSADRYTASGLPPGLHCNRTFGTISGTPGRSGVYPVLLQAQNNYQSSTTTVIFTIADGIITSGTEVSGIVGLPFVYQITADNDPNRYSASALPPGLHCDRTFGTISGTPGRSGVYTVTVQAQNDYQSSTATVIFDIADGSITSATEVSGIVGLPFLYQITADNDPNRYSASALPPGLHCDRTFGTISGKPGRSGVYPVTVQAQNDYQSSTATVIFTIADSSITGGAVTSQPTLNIVRTRDGVQLSWPSTSEGFVLEETPLRPIAWTNSAAAVVFQGNDNAATIPATNTAKFYRLRK
jgi:hypothetical protein